MFLYIFCYTNLTGFKSFKFNILQADILQYAKLNIRLGVVEMFYHAEH